MNLNFLSHFKTALLIAVASLVVAGCGGNDRVRTQSSSTVIEAPLENTNQTAVDGVIVQGIDQEGQFQSELIGGEGAWELVALADRTSGPEAIELRLNAIQQFISLQEFPAAETQTNYLVNSALNPLQTERLSLYRGQIASALGQPDLALQYLLPLRYRSNLNQDDQVGLFQSLANAQLASGARIDALISLMKTDELVRNSIELADFQLENQMKIIDLLSTLSPSEQSLLAQSASRNGLPSNLVSGWITFLPLTEMDEQARYDPLNRWANTYATHPARAELLGNLPPPSIDLQSFQHLALLLPMTSPFGNAAQAFYDGFIESHNKDTNFNKPIVSLHDIGEDAELTSFYYQSAMREGADFIVGPLGRSAVTNLLSAQSLPVPTLTLGDIGIEQSADNTYGISLSPELEAEQVAQHAFDNGHRQAAIFRSDSSNGSRAAQAFNRKWIELGGVVVTNKSFPKSIDDYSRIIQQLLEVNQSVSRERVLSAKLGVNLEFTPRRRNDIDMLFFAGDAKQARLLVPQMRFFQAHDLPIYATSKVFNGKTNPAVDADLDGIVFGDMSWMLSTALPFGAETDSAPEDGENEESVSAVSPEIPTEIETTVPPPLSKSPYQFSPLDRLYALGLESYHLIPRLYSMRQDQRQQYLGEAFGAQVRPDGNVIRLLDWATFDQGNIARLPSRAEQRIQESNPLQ